MGVFKQVEPTRNQPHGCNRVGVDGSKLPGEVTKPV